MGPAENTGDRRKDVIGATTNQAKCPNHDQKDGGKQDRIFGNALPFFT